MLEKLTLIRKEEIDNGINLPTKTKVHRLQKICVEKHKSGKISDDEYFLTMKQLMLKDYNEAEKTFNAAGCSF